MINIMSFLTIRMDEETLKNDINTNKYKGKVHFVLSHSYIVFLFAVIFGVVFDLVIPFTIFDNNYFQYIGLLLIIIGTLVVYWAQSSSTRVRKQKSKDASNLNFLYGPYRFVRNPTHLGLFISTLGLAILINSPFSILFTIVAYLITKLFFIRKEEKILEEKYGEIYKNYKSKVKSRI